MDIKEALQKLLENKDLTKSIGLNEANRRAMFYKLKNNDPSLRVDTMRQWLLKAGFTEKSTWSEPKKKKTPNVETPGVANIG